MLRLPRLLASDRPLVMGILNVTPDSFSDGGSFLKLEHALRHAMEMVDAGADIIDIGGESTRPGAEAVSVQEECDRVLPVIEAIRRQTPVALSCDTSKPEVMQAAVNAGIDLINDVRALRAQDAVDIASASGLPVCLMHMQGEPRNMQDRPVYEDLIEDVRSFFTGRIEACVAAGIERKRIILDVGFGFGKTPVHNLMLVNRLQAFLDFGLPLLVGLSRKSTIGRITDDRLAGSVAGALVAIERGARIIRCHDVVETVSAIRVWRSIQAERVLHD